MKEIHAMNEYNSLGIMSAYLVLNILRMLTSLINSEGNTMIVAILQMKKLKKRS